jgi:hypothetical protein
MSIRSHSGLVPEEDLCSDYLGPRADLRIFLFEPSLRLYSDGICMPCCPETIWETSKSAAKTSIGTGN